jgi:hypothetical protein
VTAQVIDQEYDPAIPIGEVTEHPDNPRRGVDSAVAASIEANGFFGAILVHKDTGHVLAGNTRLRAMRAAGETTVPGFWVDCDEPTARRILLADNRISDLAHYDDTLLLSLLSTVNEESSLYGTGYDQPSLELLMQAAAGDAIMGGVRQGATPEDRLEAYETGNNRSIVLPFDSDDYERAVTGLSAMRSRLGVDTNSEVVLWLLDEATAADDSGQ